MAGRAGGGIFAVVILVACLIILGLASDFLVDWLWFGEIGYPGVFWTTIVAQTATFCAAFVATAAHPVGERRARRPLRPLTVDASPRPPGNAQRHCDLAPPVAGHSSSFAMAPRHRLRREPDRHSGRLGRGA